MFKENYIDKNKIFTLTKRINGMDKINGYNELLRLVHYNRQGEGYNETEKPEKYAKFHYI